MASSSSTLEEVILHHTRCGSLSLVDRRIIQKLFSEVPMAKLKNFLALFSIRATSGITNKKAVEMCVNRYFRGSEKNRIEAVKIFQAVRSCVEFMESSVLDEIPAPLNASQTEEDDGDVTLLNTSETIGETDKSTCVAEADKTHEGLDSPRNPKIKNAEVIEDFNILTLPTEIGAISRKSRIYARDPVLDICSQDKNENGIDQCVFDVADMLKISNSPLSMESPANVGVLQGIWEPAFYEIHSCLAHFGFGCTATGLFIPNTVNFSVPEGGDGCDVILTFRTLGPGRYDCEHTHPLGLVYTLNDHSKKSEFKKAIQPPAQKDWESKLSCFSHPIVLAGIVAGEENVLYFKFPERPKDAKFHCRYEGYIFVAKPRSIGGIMKASPLIPARFTLKTVYDILIGTNSSGVPPSTISVPTLCGVTCKPIRNACKGSRCDHINFFDGENYLSLQQFCKEPRWKCSVCNEKLFWHELRHDELMEFLVQKIPQCSKLTARLDGEKLIFTGTPIEPESDDPDESD
ncbi:uncharacterized protein LOC129586191 isoform X2 [Paramacrobiotus metropolitanus]|uniref:uncharacterized protein LOC129586191 isoform X2 n=1 Tax=Paramacrobiotus metropolitanus TaxID=2943436 RepID=UPI00244599A1|nr:uncharacterized protein LOC129586191 isoform X2 [Paramacrobiotus metropolitanus]